MAPTACRRTVSGSLSLRCPRCFSPFPHGTCPLSVSRECLALADGAACFGQGSSGPALLRVLPGSRALRVRGSHPLRPAFPCGFRCARSFLYGSPTTPGAPRRPRFGLVPFRSPLLGESLLFSFPPPTWMFQFGGFASAPKADAAPPVRRVAPFGCPRIQGCSRLPAAFRGLPRPSSPP